MVRSLMFKPSVVVVGAGGSQAQAMIHAASRADDLSTWIALDRSWADASRSRCLSLGMRVEEMDALSDVQEFQELIGASRLVANLAGPYYLTGTTILNAAISAGTDYLDICDDADVTVRMLERSSAAEVSGTRALIGMGSSPGMTNVLIRMAVDYLGAASDLDIHWSVDAVDVRGAAARHFWHCFSPLDSLGNPQPVPTWEELESKVVDFSGTVGRQTVVRLSHPEPMTVPRYLPVSKSANFGTVTPYEALVLSWALAYATDPLREKESNGSAVDAALTVFERYARSTVLPRVGSGLLIDVHTTGSGLRFSSGAHTEMAEATGVPAAAGCLVMLSGVNVKPGVFPPECLEPQAFFAALRRVSQGGGGLALHRLDGHLPVERLRIRDVLATVTSGRGSHG